MPRGDALLSTLRVLDCSDGPADAVGRILADLGADVLKVEPPGGSPARRALPRLAGSGIGFAIHNANKRSVVLDPAEAAHRARFAELVSGADLLIDAGCPGQAAGYGAGAAELAERFGHLVALQVTDFGTTGPRAAWRATDAEFYALSSALSRSGPARGTPVLPPSGIASATAAVQATWAALVAYYHRLRTGRGDYIDFARLDAVVLALDPPFGSHGQAAAALGATGRWRGRPQNQDAYPILACADGHVRLVVMAPRQWRGLRAWLGEPAEFQDPKFDAIAERFRAWGEISARLQRMFAHQSMAELVATGQGYGVPIAAVLDPTEVLAAEHFRAAAATVTAELVPGVCTTVPTGYFRVDGEHVGFCTPAPDPGAPGWCAAAETRPAAPEDPAPDLPFRGLRIVDLGVIVAGGELSRLFGDLGAQVIKVESAAHPDGLRQGRPGQLLSESFAWTHRNNLGLGLDLRAPAGAELFADLVTGADAVFANFKPGTLAALGFGYDRLRQLNPQIVLAESSAFGDTGPWSNRLGYGPLVRANTGVTRLWTAPEVLASTDDRHPFFDATTVFPDHVVGRVTAIGALAGLIRRRRTGVGAHLHVSQAEVGINQLDVEFVAGAAHADHPDLFEPDTAAHGVYPCAGDDEWCVVSVPGPAQRHALDELVGGGALADWTATRAPAAVATELQGIGVPAAPMSRPADVLADPQLLARGIYRDMTHPLLATPLPAEAGPAPYRHLGPALQEPAPLPGQHTREIAREVLGLSDPQIDRLLAAGVLFSTTAPD